MRSEARHWTMICPAADGPGRRAQFDCGQTFGLENGRIRAHIRRMSKATLLAELAQLQMELEDDSEAARIEWQRVIHEGFTSPEDRKAILDAFRASNLHLAELVDRKPEIKRRLDDAQTP
jgi:hypothetical protein